MSVLLAYETGIWFSDAPVQTERRGLVLTVRSDCGEENREYRYSPIVFPPRVDLGDQILTSKVAFGSVDQVAAFASAIARFGCCKNVALLGTLVITEEKRPTHQGKKGAALREVQRLLAGSWTVLV